MGNRAVQVGLIVVFLVLGVGAAYALNGARKSNGPTASVSPSPATSPSELPSASPSASPSEAASPTPAPTEAPTAAPAPAETAAPAPAPTAAGGGGSASCSTAGSGGSGPPGYPQQISAGATYSYCGPRALVVHATSSEDRAATSVCAGINQSTQDFPAGYRGVFFVGVQFRDGQILSAGYIRENGANKDFASIQNASGTSRDGAIGGDPGSGSHTYCVTHTSSGWTMTRDGTTIFRTGGEAATDVSGTTLKFDNDVMTTGSPAAQQFTFTVPGFHDISVGGQAPRTLHGSAFYS